MFHTLVASLDITDMTDNTDKDLPNQEDDSSAHNSDKASLDLSKVAEEAMKRLDEQAKIENQGDDTTNLVAVPDEENGHTTNDLQQEAYQAMQLEAEQKRDAELSGTTTQRRFVFTPEMRLKLTSDETTLPIIKTVESELVVGRADNVTDYLPDIDLTPHGAYRLGLSRRHSVILREGNQIFVKDLNSRNGTFVNGVVVAGGDTQLIHDGDEIRFGNLVMLATFED